MKVHKTYTISSQKLNREQLKQLIDESARLCNVELMPIDEGHVRTLASYSCAVGGEAKEHSRFTARLEGELAK